MTEAMPRVTDDELMMSNTLYVRLEDREAHIDALNAVLPQAKSRPGCLLLEAGDRVDCPGTFVLAERWRSGAEYLNEYLNLPFYREHLEKTESMYATPRQVAVLSGL